jgi:hypothetical protein
MFIVHKVKHAMETRVRVTAFNSIVETVLEIYKWYGLT